MRTARLVALSLLAAAIFAAAPAPVTASGHSGEVLEATLDNGLRVLVLEDHRSPIVSVQVWYKVGSRNERPGATGLAHFLEHMMFKGTPTHGKGEFARLVERNGGQDNAFTAQDMTSYFVNIAADKLDLVLRLEADRMRHLLLDPKEIDSERQVVMEERRTRTEDDADGLLSEELSAIAFKAHPYRWPIIGWMEEINRINPPELRAFYDTYYVPNNAILAVVGDVKAPDAPALELLSTILSEGRASRLYRKLVYEKRMALGAGGDYSYASVDPNLFWFYATPLPGHTVEALERALLDEIEGLKSEPVPDEELARAKNQIEASFVWRQDSVHSRASGLVRFEMLGSWRLLDRFVPMIRAVTAADIQRVARAYFPSDRKNVGVLLPAEPPAPAGK